MQMDEAIAFANIARVPLEDVLVHAGLRPPAGKGMVPVVGTIDAAGDLHRGQVEAPRRVAAPPECTEGTVAARFKTASSAAEALNGWTIYYMDGIERVPAEAIGQLCVVQFANHGPTKIGYVRRGYERGTYSVSPWTPGTWR